MNISEAIRKHLAEHRNTLFAQLRKFPVSESGVRAAAR